MAATSVHGARAVATWPTLAAALADDGIVDALAVRWQWRIVMQGGGSSDEPEVVSVILPVHNGEHWIDGCLESLLAQSVLSRPQTPPVTLQLSAFELTHDVTPAAEELGCRSGKATPLGKPFRKPNCRSVAAHEQQERLTEERQHQ